MTIPIIFEDNDLLVINKPSGLVVNRADTTSHFDTLEDWLMTNRHLTLERAGIVHRLDKDTSGLLIVAKNPASFENLQEQFKSRGVIKKYLALVHGLIEPRLGSINAPVARSPFNRMHFGVFPGGREAVTDYKLIKNYGQYSLLELTPHTGRTHQIRVHLKYIGHPIVSDPLYGGRKNLQSDQKFCPRLFLHASYLQFSHPKTGEILEFSQPLPEELSGVLSLIDA